MCMLGDQWQATALASVFCLDLSVSGRNIYVLSSPLRAGVLPISIHGQLMNCNDVKLVVCDVDGTVAIDGCVVSSELKTIFEVLSRRGIAATLATGRMPHHTRSVAHALGLTGHLICAEGGCVVSVDGAEYLHHPHLSPEAMAAAAAIVADGDEGLKFAVLSRDTIYVGDDETRWYARPWGSGVTTIAHWTDAADPLLVLIFGPPEAIDDLAVRLEQNMPDSMAVILEKHTSSYHQIKLCSKQVDKGVATRVLGRHLGIGMENVLVFGDWLNDLGLMRAAGYSIAPSSGAPEARAVASKVSAYSCAEGFVARELEAMFGP